MQRAPLQVGSDHGHSRTIMDYSAGIIAWSEVSWVVISIPGRDILYNHSSYNSFPSAHFQCVLGVELRPVFPAHSAQIRHSRLAPH